MTELEKLSGNIALITGAASDFGQAMARQLNAEGCALHLADDNETILEDIVESLGDDDGNEPETHPTDLSDAINAAALALECEEVDILINIPPPPPAGTIDDLDNADWQQAFEETVLAAINMTREVYESMQEIGTGMIFNLGCTSEPGDVCRETVNAALKAFSENLDQEAISHGVRVYFCQPGPKQNPKGLAGQIIKQILGHHAS